jgi:RNA polymerase sigma-70 factor (ECF subfamily)
VWLQMTPVSNTNLARQIDRDEFVALLVRHDRRVRSFIATLLARTNDIEEVVQSTCLVAWRKIETFTYQDTTPDEEFVRWLCTIARYEVMSLRRDRASSRLVFNDDLIDRLAAMQLNEASYREQRHQALISCMQHLRHRDREMTRQFYEARATVNDLAARFGIGANAVYKSLTRIRATLLECIQRTMRQEERL